MASPIKTVKDTRALLQELNRHPDVEYAVPNLIYEMVASPNDPYYSSSGAWGQDYKDMWGLHNINAERAWDVTQGEGIVVAVVDTGIDYMHEDIDQNIWQNPGETGNDSSGKNKSSNGIDDDNNGYVDDWRGWDFPALSEEGEDNNPMDDHYHGTHVAGTIAAIGNNSQGVIGVAPKAKIMALKALNQNGVGTTVSVARAIMYAADNGARVINASLGALLPIPDRPMEEAINYAVDVKGVVFVAAAGNDDSNVERVTLNTGNNGRNGEGDGSIRLSFYYPASSEKVITVAASNHLDEKAYFSNFGPKIDVAAPGGGDQDESNPNPYPEKSILSLLSSKANLGLVRGGPDRVGGGKYFRAEGTSMAAPHVAGVAALVLSKNPHFLVEQVRQAIRLGADDAGATGFDQDTGHGRINAARALEIVAPPAPDITSINNNKGGAGLNISSSIAGQDFSRWALYEAFWTPGALGETELTAVIEVEDGERLISSPLRLTVVANTPPDLRLTNASWPEHQAGNDGISIYVQAKDPDGKKGKKPTYDGLKVEIYNFDKLMGTASPFLNRGKNPSFPDFFFVWERATAGDYSIRVVATDKDGNTTRLKLLNFSIKPPQ